MLSGWSALGFRFTCCSALADSDNFIFRYLLVGIGGFGQRPHTPAAAVFAGRSADRWWQMLWQSGLWFCREVRQGDQWPVPDQKSGATKLTHSTPIPQSPASSLGAECRVLGVGEAVDDAPKADWFRAVRPQSRHDRRCQRMLNASQWRGWNLRPVWRCDNYHANNYSRQFDPGRFPQSSRSNGIHHCSLSSRPDTSASGYERHGTWRS